MGVRSHATPGTRLVFQVCNVLRKAKRTRKQPPNKDLNGCHKTSLEDVEGKENTPRRNWLPLKPLNIRNLLAYSEQRKRDSSMASLMPTFWYHRQDVLRNAT